jgi:hypothetical protein
MSVPHFPVDNGRFCLDHETKSSYTSNSSNTEDLALDAQRLPAPVLQPCDPLKLEKDEIIVQDKGRYRLKQAWFFLILGRNVFDSSYQPITVERLESQMVSTGERDSVYCRRQLWKTVPRHYWNVDDQPAQPGITYNEHSKEKGFFLPILNPAHLIQ